MARDFQGSRADHVIVIEGRREAGEAEVSSRSIRYFPFTMPRGVTRISIRKELDFGPDGRGTVDHGLFDPGGAEFGGPGYRGWQGGTGADIVLTGGLADSGPWFVPGPIQAGEWNLAQWFLVSTPVGLGFKYTITLSFDGTPAPDRFPDVPAYDPGALNPHPGWYVGQLHCHTVHSDGGLTVSELVAHCKAAGLQFVVPTDHNNPRAHYHLAEAASKHPDVLLFSGQEITSPFGHANVTGCAPGYWFDFRLDGGDGRLPQHIEEAHRQGAMFTVNHPFATCTTCLWRYPEREWESADAIEVWNGSWKHEERLAVELWDRLLRTGRRIPAVGGADFHRIGDRLMPTVWVYAESLSQPAILEGLRRGRSFLSESPRGPLVYLGVEGQMVLPGDSVRVGGEGDVSVEARVVGGNGMTLRLIWPGSEVELAVEEADVTLRHRISVDAARPAYVRAELARKGGDVAALTNPIYIGE